MITHLHSQFTGNPSNLIETLNRYHDAGIDPAFDTEMDELERQFAEYRLTLASELREATMHHLMLVTLELPENATSSVARFRAYELLTRDPSFAGDGGRFGSPLCDWFVIGGRWSGLLKETLLGEPYKAAFEGEFPEMAKGFFPSSLIEKNRDCLNRLWQQCGGTGDSPVTRRQYDHGHDDDAMLVDAALYQRFLAQYSGESTRVDGDSSTFADLDDDPVNETFIGRKWLVVVDYHN